MFPSMNSGNFADDPPAAQDPPGHALESSLRSLRLRLDELLHRDEDLSAFLLDEFPKVHREMSSDMSRTRRVEHLI